MKILMIAPELDPFVKVGGLGDVAGALSKELAAKGHDVRCVCPLYRSVKRGPDWKLLPEPLGANVGTGTEWAAVWETILPGTQARVYFLEHERFYGREGVYSGLTDSYPDNDHRFIFASRAALNLCLHLNWIPDVIHCHDWTAGFVPVWLNTTDRNGPLGPCATVLTIHNLEHQGYCHRRALDYAGLPAWLFSADNAESLGAVNLLKAGLYHSTKITTVSPTYSREIRTPAQGHGLDHVLRFRGADLIGILNGIDENQWNPATDPLLPANFKQGDLRGKAKCKAALQKELGLKQDPDAPLFGVVSRFFRQKGLDLLADVIPAVVNKMPAQFAILGTGDADLEAAYRRHGLQFAGRVGGFIGFDNRLAHLVQGGSDFFAMPSRAEPCGLTQMYAMRYGSVPVVRSTGGLVDTVEDYDDTTGAGTGFRFEAATHQSLFDSLTRACEVFTGKPGAYKKLQAAGMGRDFGWSAPADRYLQVYGWAIDARSSTSA